jgi:hypothetical protein
MITEFQMPSHAERILDGCYDIPLADKQQYLWKLAAMTREAQIRSLQSAVLKGGNEGLMAGKLLGKVPGVLPGACNKAKNPIHKKS